MVNIEIKLNAPEIGYKIEECINKLDSPENHVLSLQLDYRDNNTIFYLKKIDLIKFEEEWLEIKQENNSHAFFDYNNILEYCIINAEDIIDLEMV